MPAPVLPSEFTSSIPLNNALLCTRFDRFLGVPSLLSRFFSWMLTAGGALSDEFKAEIAASIVPVGTPLFSFSANVGSMYLLSDGSEVSRTAYSALYTAIGTRYGVGDNSTTFNLPDMRGRIAIGAGTGSGLTNRDINTKYIGAETHVMTLAELAEHTHEVVSSSAGSTNGDGGHILNIPEPVNNPPIVPPHTTEPSGESAPMDIMNPCIIGYWYIKVI